MSARHARARAYVQRRAAAEMDVKVVVRRMSSDGVLDEASLVVVPVAQQTIYTGSAFLHSIGSGGEIMVGESPVPVRSTVISLPASAPAPRPDDVVTITACPEDATVVGLGFRVRSVEGGADGAAAVEHVVDEHDDLVR